MTKLNRKPKIPLQRVYILNLIWSEIMTWNKPGGNQDNQNPWGGGGKKPNNPVDFQKFLQDFKKHLQQLSGKTSPKGPLKFQKFRYWFSNYGHYAIPATVITVFLLWGITIVDSGEQAVVLKLGKFNRTLNPGIHWVPPLLEKVLTIRQQQINAVTYSGNVITADNAVLTFAVNIQYRIADPKTYLFSVADPSQRLEDAVATSIDQVISKQSADALLNHTKQELNQQLLKTLTQQLNIVDAGFNITDVSVQSLEVPAAVSDAHNDVKQAQQDSQLVTTQAKESAAQIITQAQAQIEQLLSEAKAYQQKVVLKAQSDTARYLALLPEYQQNPTVTRERLYVETMQQVLGKVSKIFVDAPNNSNIQLNLPSAAMPVTMNSPASAKNTSDESIDTSSQKNNTEAITSYGSDYEANSY